MWENEWFESVLQSKGPWTSHEDGEGYIYFYNRQTQESTWKPPFDSDIFDVTSAISTSGIWSMHEDRAGNIYYYNQDENKSSWIRPHNYDNSMELQLKLLNHPQRKITEVQIDNFYELLRTKHVAHDSEWESVLPKIAYDHRFTAIKSMDVRRSLFDHYITTIPEPNGLIHLAKLLATPLAARILNRRSTLSSFLLQLDNDVRSRLERALRNTTRSEQENLFKKRLNILQKLK